MIEIFKVLAECSRKIHSSLFKHSSRPIYQGLKKITFRHIEENEKSICKEFCSGNNIEEGYMDYQKKMIQKNLSQCASFEKYTLIEKMGDGAYSEVYKAICNETKEYVAIKAIRKYQLNYTQKVSVFKEIRIMQDINHPNIVRFLGFLENNDYYFLILELVEGGEIFYQIVRLTYFSEELSKHIITQVAHAIHYLHEEKGVVHRDIKPENILFKPIPFLPRKYSKSKKDMDKIDEGEFIQGFGSGTIGQVKIADFGLSKVVWDKQTKTPCGTIGYTAPEIIKDQKYSKCVDMWALGCVLYTFLCGFPPFYDENAQILSRKVARGEFTFASPWWDKISKSAQDLISNLLTVDPKKRYTIDQFLNHPWIRESKNQTLNNTSHPSNSLTINPISSWSYIRDYSTNKEHNKEYKNDFRSPDTVSLRDIFDISYKVQRIKEENTYKTSILLDNTFQNNLNNISYYIEETIQRKLYHQIYHSPNENIYTSEKQKKHTNNGKNINSSFNPLYLSNLNSSSDHFSYYSQSCVELLLEKSTLLCRRKALFAL
ncbi:hypothetical protein T552_03009 [Pneumocystis carinii B80]|uniref:Protein kinase domain-containing protein n=1 Tax=Pneumocystis carinii (strain B80) TaxID=1408658 RepID=A0A0W4ZCM6_PNEC8|nr:hypothetical protein T552_03009 [Pneumocystis carinii B80]KTW26115.1 hypothetical protein T552_03009 [Pneumocystis carinii B80]